MSQLTAVLDALQALCAEGQVMVDLFVNYDCDLQAANLFERSMKGLSKLLRRAPTTAPFSSPQAAKAREVALEAVLSILKSLDKWADPLKVSYTPGSGLLFSLSGNICRQCKAKLNNAWKQYNNVSTLGRYAIAVWRLYGYPAPFGFFAGCHPVDPKSIINILRSARFVLLCNV